MRTTKDPKQAWVSHIIHNADFSGLVTIVDFRGESYEIPGDMLLSGAIMTINRDPASGGIPSEVIFRAIALVNRQFIFEQLGDPGDLEDPDRFYK